MATSFEVGRGTKTLLIQDDKADNYKIDEDGRLVLYYGMNIYIIFNKWDYVRIA